MGYAETIVKHLSGDWHGRYGLAPGPNHGKRDRSLKIAAHATDPDDVVVYSFSGDDVLALKREWREQGLLPLGGRKLDPIRSSSAKIEARKREESAAAAAAEAERQQTVSWLWDRRKDARGTVVETYLRSRGIDINPFPHQIGHLPPSPPKHPYPAMVAPFGAPDEHEPGIYRMPRESVKGLHITYLKPDGSGKAPIDPQRRMLGSVKGCPLALVPPNDGLGLLIAEGIETALSGHLATGLGCWAAGSAPFMPALASAIPAWTEVVMVAAEADPAGRRGAEALVRAIEERGIETIALEV